jgi:hypothetical protein
LKEARNDREVCYFKYVAFFVALAGILYCPPVCWGLLLDTPVPSSNAIGRNISIPAQTRKWKTSSLYILTNHVPNVIVPVLTQDASWVQLPLTWSNLMMPATTALHTPWYDKAMYMFCNLTCSTEAVYDYSLNVSKHHRRCTNWDTPRRSIICSVAVRAETVLNVAVLTVPVSQ